MGLEVKKYYLTLDTANTFQDYEKQLEDEIGKKKRGKKGSSTKVMDLVEVVLQPPAWDADYVAADSKDFQITTQKETAIVNLSDKDVVLKWGEVIFATLATGIPAYQKVRKLPVNRYIIKKEIHFGCDSNEVADKDWHVELGFKYTYLSDWALARMIGRLY